jgi:hypothetical protein
LLLAIGAGFVATRCAGREKYASVPLLLVDRDRNRREFFSFVETSFGIVIVERLLFGLSFDKRRRVRSVLRLGEEVADDLPLRRRAELRLVARRAAAHDQMLRDLLAARTSPATPRASRGTAGRRSTACG